MENNKTIIPPIKCQGIKTKIIPFIREHVKRNESGLWIEPFVGTGVVAFNLKPKRAILNDKNQYIISFYQKIQTGEISSDIVRDFLEYHGAILAEKGNEYYIEMRENFKFNIIDHCIVEICY